MRLNRCQVTTKATFHQNLKIYTGKLTVLVTGANIRGESRRCAYPPPPPQMKLVTPFLSAPTPPPPVKSPGFWILRNIFFEGGGGGGELSCMGTQHLLACIEDEN